MRNRTNPLLMLATAALVAGGAAFAQSPSLTQPNNSAGTTLDVPRLHMPGPVDTTGGLPVRTENAQSAFDKLDTSNRGYVTRDEIDRLPNASQIPFDRADLNHDGRLDANEFQGAWNGAGPSN
jgi:hypothetical protein